MRFPLLTMLATIAIATTSAVGAQSNADTTTQQSWLEVPVTRGTPESGHFRLPYIRLEAAEPTQATPIFLLAGGPGASWITNYRENEETRAEAEFYSGFADVVLFDQRGAGLSEPRLRCGGRTNLPNDKPYSGVNAADQKIALSEECLENLSDLGPALEGLTTLENAADVDALRRHLGYEKITLIGGSYGSHLALTYMRLYPQHVERAVLFGVEGPDDTWDDPDAVLETLRRIAGDAEQSPALDGVIPQVGLIEALRLVRERLAAEPARLTFERDGQEQEIFIGAEDVEMIARVMAGRRSRADFWPRLVAALYEGNYTPLLRGFLQIRQAPIADPIHYVMDCSSGISPDRRQRIDSAEARRILGNINADYDTLCEHWPSVDLGAEFRNPVQSEIPALIVHGTWDTSTPLENAQGVAAQLSNGKLVTVEGGTHGAIYNLYEHWPPMRVLMREWLVYGRDHFPERVVMPPVEYGARVGRGQP